MLDPELLKQLFDRMTDGKGPGINVLIRRVYTEMYDVAPSEVETASIARAFQDAWDAKYGSPRAFNEYGGGRRVIRKPRKEPSPWVEQNQKTLEDTRDTD